MTKFKSESFIVLMVIAWTYLLHAYYRSKRVEYRYYRQKAKKRVFDRTKRGAYKYWELERCLNEEKCPLDKDTSNNLRFLIGLRHEIEHQMHMGPLPVWPGDNAAAAKLDQPRQLRRRDHGQHTILVLEIDAIVGHEKGGETLVFPALEKGQGQDGLARTRGAAQQNAGFTQDETRPMHVDWFAHGSGVYLRARGSTIVKIAPERSVRFCARIRPLWASTICLEMESPSPE